MKTNYFQKLEKTLGGIKLAVILILIFTVFMIVGTLLESSSGADYANRMVYKRLPFMLVQFGMFLSILFAAFLRLPPKKRLYGFYTIHLGLILLGCGSFVTWYAGIDGSLALTQNNPARRVELNEDVFFLEDVSEGKIFTKKMPYTALTTELNDEIKGIRIKKFLPFSDNKLEWLDTTDSFPSSQYILFNNNITQDFILSLNPNAPDFKSTLTMGKLNLHYLPGDLAECFKKDSPSKLIIWNLETKSCFTPEEKKIAIKTSNQGNRFFVLPKSLSPDMVSFFPEFSPWPLDEKLKVNQSSSYRVLSKKLFEESPTLFLFGDKLSYFSEGKWEFNTIDKNSTIQLPWMGFELKMLTHTTNKIPTYIPVYTKPRMEKGQVVSGAQKAILVEARGKEHWITDNSNVSLLIDGKKYVIGIKKSHMDLPFEFTLTKFKMDHNPGTLDPASYESFVRLFTKEGPSEHHIFMNNPLKYSGFTFYQASYFKDENENYGTVLSVNADPGRPIKYFGAILVILGSIWHFVIRSEFFKRNDRLAEAT